MGTRELIDVDSGYGSEFDSGPEEIAMRPIAQVGQAIAIIDSVRGLVVHWNKRQCQRLVDRFKVIEERFKKMGWDKTNQDGGEAACDGGPRFDALVKILEKGATLMEGYIGSNGVITSTVVSRTDNREEFREIHDELNDIEEQFGFQNWVVTVESIGVEEKLLEDANLDKRDMSTLQTTSMGAQSEELAKALSDRATVVDVPKLVEDHARTGAPLPSYLSIDQKSQILRGELIRKYVRKSDQDREEEVGWAFVYSGSWLGCTFAIKVFSCGGTDAGASEWNKTQLLMEVGKLVELQHPHVVRLVGFGQDDEECVFVMELMDRDLRNFIDDERERALTESEELDIISQIAKGMHFMHTKGYVHGDLKCSNILVKKIGGSLQIKISDLRGSQSLDKEWDPKAFKQVCLTRRPRWTAPEAIDYDKFWEHVKPSNFKDLLRNCDIYSFGMTCFEVVTGKYPFHRKKGKELLEQIKDRDGVEKWNKHWFPAGMDEDLKGLIIKCWSTEPSERPSFETICHLLDTIRYKKLNASEKIMLCGVKVATMLSQICIDSYAKVAQVPQALRLFGNSGPPTQQIRLARSSSSVKVPDYLMIEPEQLKRSINPIGQGNDGRVFKATWLGCTFAVKILMNRSLNDNRSYTSALQREVDFLMSVSRHPCIVQMVGLSRNRDGEQSIVMEYMDSNLRQLIAKRLKGNNKRTRPFTLDEAVLIITKIAWGMAYLHSKGVVHRDLNPSNVLGQDYGKTIDVKIMDFGMSQLEEPSNSSNNSFYNGVGSGFYRAPEMLPLVSNEELLAEFPAKGTKVDLRAWMAADVYSFAMICHEVLTGASPWSHIRCLTDYAEVRKGQYTPKWPLNPQCLESQLISITERCWQMDPKRRPTFYDICTSDLQKICTPGQSNSPV